MGEEDKNRLSLRLGVKPLRAMFTFSGRSTRTEVVSFYLLSMVATLGFVMVHFVVPFGWQDSLLFKLLSTAFQALFAFPYLALFVRRLRDQDRSLRWLWIGAAYFVSLAGLMLVPEGEHGSFSVSALGWIRHPAWSPLSILLTIAGMASIFALLILTFKAGTPGPNRHGPDPRV